MSSFTAADMESTGEYRDGRPLYRLLQAFSYDIGYVGSGLSIHVPKGFITDGPTMPAWLLRIVPAHTMMKSAIVHDYLREDLRFSKRFGDDIFHDAMVTERTPWWLRKLAYWAVRLNNSRARAK